MNIEEIIGFIEDKDFEINDNWYFHATSNNAEVVMKILEEGIKSSYLRNVKQNPNLDHFNGKYYISLYKYKTLDDGLNKWLDKYPRFVIDDIKPLYADRRKLNLRRMFINTRLPLRTSEWDGEYQQYLFIEPSKFVALGYDLSYMFKDIEGLDKDIIIKLQKDNLQLLKNIIVYMNQIEKQLPIYDFSTKKEINKEKVLSLNI